MGTVQRSAWWFDPYSAPWDPFDKPVDDEDLEFDSTGLVERQLIERGQAAH